MRNFSKEHVLVTGGGTGIGLAIAAAFSKTGARVTISGRDEKRLLDQASKMEKTQALAVDVTEEASITKGLEQAARTFGPVTILVNNAGAVESAPLQKMDSGFWQRMLDVNLNGVFSMTRAVFPAMKEAGRGKIINIASTAGLEGFAYTSAYCAAKHGVVGFTRALAEEFKEGITINAVCPGFTRTDMVERAITNIMKKTGMDRKRAEAEIIKLNPGGRLVEPEEVAEVVLELASGKANGEIIPLTGEGGKLNG